MIYPKILNIFENLISLKIVINIHQRNSVYEKCFQKVWNKRILYDQGCIILDPDSVGLTLTRPIGLPPHAPVVRKIADQR